MSGEDRRLGAPQDPPWSVDELADFHAGVLDQHRADELRPVITADPEAQEILAALDTTSADLGTLPPLTIPDDVSARIEAALQDEVRAWSQPTAPVTALPTRSDNGQGQPEKSGTAPVVDLDSARRRRRRVGWGAGLLTAAAAVLGVAVLSPTLLDTGGDPQAVDSGPSGSLGPPPLAFQGSAVTLNRSELTELLKSDQRGELSDPQKLIGCLKANGVNSANPLGARTVTLNGHPAQLLILSTGKIGQFRLLTVGPECGPGNPATLSDSTFGG